ncbi:DUF4142 domain-containing protein [Streptomyces sp. NPDC052013]|uniref:DUF4142 domain-containing protein n=1 Tax=unclassified Streptomyces TaxID=2593676 RepID=UPI00344C0C53
MRISRSTAGTAFVGGAMILTLAALAYPTMLGVQNTSTKPDRIIANTNYGPLTEADRDFVVKVRAAGLWEHPLGLLAMERGTTPEMKEAGEHLVVGHGRLDASCRKISIELGITLPNQASPQQEQFVETVNSATGREFDSVAANIMRVTHGQIFPAIAKIRASTRNTLIRQLADQANDTVLDHMTVLEKTGMVNQEQVNFQQTSPPKMPAEQVTPPAPPAGAPVKVLEIPKGLEDLNTVSPAPSPSGTVK